MIDLVRLAIEMVAGRWRNDDALAIEHVPEVVIRTAHRQVQVMIDGEVEQMPIPLEFRIRPAALSILAPKTADEGQ